MANITPSPASLHLNDPDARVVSWAMGIADTGLPIESFRRADKSVQIAGTIGGATIVIQGSNDGSNWSTLRDPASVDLSFTAAGLKAILEHTRFIRPVTSGGTGSAIVVSIYFSGPAR